VLPWGSQALRCSPPRAWLRAGPHRSAGPRSPLPFPARNRRVPSSAQRGQRVPPSQQGPALQEQGCWSSGYCALRATGEGRDPRLTSLSGFHRQRKSPADMPSPSGGIKPGADGELGLPAARRGKGQELVRCFPGGARQRGPGGQAEDSGACRHFHVLTAPAAAHASPHHQ